MDNFEKFNSEKLSASEMKEVQGEGILDDLLKVVDTVTPLVAPLIDAVTGGK
ncbi:hypothetical protein ABXT06_10410 [Flavobacterium sp. UW10123]|uniref:hypothetical protein n=1 Tax=Flavobacterium sp. UW10123 TaxID=3230800 RepID=UPI00339B5F06